MMNVYYTRYYIQKQMTIENIYMVKKIIVTSKKEIFIIMLQTVFHKYIRWLSEILHTKTNEWYVKIDKWERNLCHTKERVFYYSVYVADTS